MTYKKKLIEAALPLETINKAAAREKIHTPWTPRHPAPVVGVPSFGGGADKRDRQQLLQPVGLA